MGSCVSLTPWKGENMTINRIVVVVVVVVELSCHNLHIGRICDVT